MQRLAKQSPILASEKEEDDGTIPVEEVARRYGVSISVQVKFYRYFLYL